MAREKKPNDGTPKVPARSRSKKAAAATMESATATPNTLNTATKLDTASAEEKIRRRAYELSMSRGHHGNPDEDWLRAEAEIRGKHSA